MNELLGTLLFGIGFTCIAGLALVLYDKIQRWRTPKEGAS